MKPQFRQIFCSKYVPCKALTEHPRKTPIKLLLKPQSNPDQTVIDTESNRNQALCPDQVLSPKPEAPMKLHRSGLRVRLNVRYDRTDQSSKNCVGPSFTHNHILTLARLTNTLRSHFVATVSAHDSDKLPTTTRSMCFRWAIATRNKRCVCTSMFGARLACLAHNTQHQETNNNTRNQKKKNTIQQILRC